MQALSAVAEGGGWFRLEEVGLGSRDPVAALASLRAGRGCPAQDAASAGTEWGPVKGSR